MNVAILTVLEIDFNIDDIFTAVASALIVTPIVESFNWMLSSLEETM